MDRKRSGDEVTTRLLVLADTHLTPETVGRLPGIIWEAAEVADAILHAGDVVCRELLDALGAVAPTHAVLGNNDVGRIELPEELRITVESVEFAVVHDTKARKGRERRIQKWYPDADLVVFGHSHEPVDVEGENGQRLLNPGSATQRRRQPMCSYGWVEVDGSTFRSEIRLLDTT